MKKFPLPLPKEFEVFKKLNTPQKIQDFLGTFPFNFEKHGDTNMSPLETLRAGTAHCMEGAMLAAAILWYHGQSPFLLDLKTTNDDQDHVVTLFKQDEYWGAISKTNHGVLRYREPIFKSVRELVLSYFSEYFLHDGRKTLRSYSKPFDMSKLDLSWLTSKKDLWNVVRALDKSPHVDIVNKKQIKNLRLAEPVEIEAGKVIEWKK
jgi:hypothetical protein